MQNIEHYLKTNKPHTQKWLNSGDDIFSYLGKESNARSLPLIDRLTGLVNQQGFIKSLEKEIDRTRRDLSKGGLVLMIDIDNFNDFSHSQKISALKLIGKTILDDIRPMDSAARLSVDNFFILLPDANGKNTERRAQNLLKKLNNLSFIHEQKEIDLRCSLGFVEYTKHDDVRSVLRKAGMVI